jgi:hypothetical protein
MRLTLAPASHGCNGDTKVFLCYNMNVIITLLTFLLNHSIYYKNYIKILWVVLKIYANIGTDSGKRLCFILCPVWCPGHNKRIAPLPFFHKCLKRRLKD